MITGQSVYRVTPTDKDGKATGPEITKTVRFNEVQTLEEVQAIKGYSEAALASVVNKYLKAHVSQGPIKKLMCKGEDVESKPFDLYFPSFAVGNKKADEEEALRRKDVRESAIRKFNAMTPEQRTAKEKKLNKEYESVEIPEDETSPGIFLFSLELYDFMYK